MTLLGKLIERVFIDASVKNTYSITEWTTA